jgi:hypothetical protein
MGDLSRRSVLKGLAGLAGLVAARPLGGLAASALGGPGSAAASRRSRLFPRSRAFVVHTDLHNHTLVSGDAVGSPEVAYADMRRRGLDVASLTEHAISGKDHGEVSCPDHESPCRIFEGINETDWREMREVADRFDDPGRFVTVPGFEWSTPTIGHCNVWYSADYTDALHQNAFVTPRAISEADRVGLPSEIADQFETAPDIATMSGFYDWLQSPPDRVLRGGGNDGIACFNHPNEFGNFEGFRYDPAVAPYLVSVEALNQDRDFFWYGSDRDMPNPLATCLDAGWRVGFTGVSDEHGPPYGRPNRGRGGLWVRDLTRNGVRTALATRRSFASFVPGLRLDAAANGAPMGGVVRTGFDRLRVRLDIDRGPAWAGKRLLVEAVTSGARLAGTFPIRVPAPGRPPPEFTVRGARRWLFLRITDPARRPDRLATEPYRSHGGVVAYASPFFDRSAP